MLLCPLYIPDPETERMLKVPYFLARLRTRDPQRRMNFVLEALMRFPFSAPGEPGYAVRAWSDAGGFHTHWTYYAPLGFVRRYVERHGDGGTQDATAPAATATHEPDEHDHDH